MPVYEVTAAGFDGGTDATDDRVIWVKADSQDSVADAINGLGARLWDRVGDCPEGAIDFDLTDYEQRCELAAVLRYFQRRPSMNTED